MKSIHYIVYFHLQKDIMRIGRGGTFYYNIVALVRVPATHSRMAPTENDNAKQHVMGSH
jgi:hypothetical protein